MASKSNAIDIITAPTRTFTIGAETKIILDKLNNSLRVDVDGATVDQLLPISSPDAWAIKLVVTTPDSGVTASTVTAFYGESLADMVPYPQTRHGNNNSYGIIGGYSEIVDNSGTLRGLDYDATTGTDKLDLTTLDSQIVVYGNNLATKQQLIINATGATTCQVSVTVLSFNNKTVKVS